MNDRCIFDEYAFSCALAKSDAQDYSKRLQVFQEALATTRQSLSEGLEEGADIRVLIKQWTAYVDRLLVYLWLWYLPKNQALALVAVGGFGRGELHPFSDIDLLVLHEDLAEKPIGLQNFLQLLWDIGLDVGHSVRSLTECAEASADVTVATNLLEARFLCGSATLYQRFEQQKAKQPHWSDLGFYEAKCAEKKARYAKFGHSAYRLEPNLKQSPGGLRDIQTLEWLNRFIFKEKTLSHLVEKGWLTHEEWQQWQAAQAFFFALRWRLHQRSGRKEDRLSFDHQTALAEAMGYQQGSANAKVEGLMQRYYRHIHEIRYSTELLWRSFYFYIAPAQATVFAGDEDFLLVGNYLDFCHREALVRRPELIFQAFIILAQEKELLGLTAAAIRSIVAHRHLLHPKSGLRQRLSPYFRRLLQLPRLQELLFWLHRYQVLGSYLPAFAAVTGQMQYDLFHIYTVDEHTLRVMAEAVALIEDHSKNFEENHTLLLQVAASLPQADWLYLAALFHDIGKGRGGSHSEVGAEEARLFLQEHQYPEEAQALITWLVQEHLLLSATAQKSDLEDPQTIAAFAEKVQTLERLDYLYVLTVADIRGTNPSLWTTWKAALLEQLYRKARAYLMATTTAPSEPSIAALCCADEDQLAAYSPSQMHNYAALLQRQPLPVVSVRNIAEAPAGEIVIVSNAYEGFFATVAAKLEKLELNIVEAHFYRQADGLLLAIFSVLEINGQKPQGSFRKQELQQGLLQAIRLQSPPQNHRRLSAQLRSFSIPLRLEWQQQNGYSCLTLRFADYPGLLARIAQVLASFPQVQLQKARITTLGQQVLDIFWLQAMSPESNRAQPLDEACQQALAQALQQTLSALKP
jgi:[protein-PII] uridylyltransferase